MRRRVRTTAATVLVVVPLVLAWPGLAAAALRKCTICHGKPAFKKVLASGRVVSLYVDEAVLSESVHMERKCVDCHADVVEIPHRNPPTTVNCTRCHYRGNVAGAPQQVDYEAYRRSVHGRLAAQGDPKAPACQGCHGNHEVLPRDDPRSRIVRASVPTTCGTCHLTIYNEYIE
ncbi:MAG: cytochrome c3 family protein, partial [Nitrospinota bacterium]